MQWHQVLSRTHPVWEAPHSQGDGSPPRHTPPSPCAHDQVIRHSSLYETLPAYVTEQPSFLNAAVLARTQLQPLQLLAALKQLEQRAGREAGGVRFGPRPLDLDIVFYGDVELQHERLQIPHPRCLTHTCLIPRAADNGMPHHPSRIP